MSFSFPIVSRKVSAAPFAPGAPSFTGATTPLSRAETVTRRFECSPDATGDDACDDVASDAVTAAGFAVLSDGADGCQKTNPATTKPPGKPRRENRISRRMIFPVPRNLRTGKQQKMR